MVLPSPLIRQQCLKSTYEVSRPAQTKLAECGRGKTGAVALVADEDVANVGISCDGQVIRRGGVESPLKNITVDDDRARQLATSLPLLQWADVDHDCAGRYFVGKVGWFDSLQAGSGSREEPVNGRLVVHCMPPRVSLGMIN
jgi:hypothetical protein